MDARHTAQRLGEFTVPELAAEHGHVPSWAREKVSWMVSLGIVENTGRYRRGQKRGRPAMIFAYIPIPVTQTARRRVLPPEVEVVKKVKRAAGAPTGRRSRQTNRRRRTIAALVGQDVRVVKVTRHTVRLQAADGRQINAARTPSDHRADRNALRRSAA